MISLQDASLCIVGLGYVGLPLAVEFGKKYKTIGFDLNEKRISELTQHIDRTREVSREELSQANLLQFSKEIKEAHLSNVFIVAVPTPIDEANRPNFRPLESASRLVATVLQPGDVVIFESTVYPGATEEICMPLLEQGSGLKFNKDFFCGYSPERINPGDKTHRLTEIVKITSGSTAECASFVDSLYASIITAGTFTASSIRVAEAAKVIENTQRDVNIALINELALIFDRLDINTSEVLAAASTKWNFLPFRPGIVGGHCIGVDPYYLTHKAQEVGYHPDMILAGRRLNDHMGAYIAATVIKKMLCAGIDASNGKVLIMGLTFKENCPDLRNTKVVDIIDEFDSYGMEVDVWDPWASPEDALLEYNIELLENPQPGTYDAVVIAVAHQQFTALSAADLREFCRTPSVIYDVKSIYPRNEVDGSL